MLKTFLHRVKFMFAFVLFGVFSVTAQTHVELVEVVGEKSVSLLKRQYKQYEEEFFSLYNEVVDDVDMRMRCEFKQVRLQSRVKKRICLPNYVYRIIDDERQRATGLLNSVDTSQVAGSWPQAKLTLARIEESNIIFAKKVKSLVDEHPALAVAFERYAIVKERLDEAKQSARSN